MALTTEKKKSILEEFKLSPKDTGSSQVQISLITERINQLSGHFKKAPKDFGSRQGLLKLVGQRKQLLSYLKSENLELYKKLIVRLDLRK